MSERDIYYPPTGKKREAIKQEIVNAIHSNPNQDPSKTIAEGKSEPQSTYDHLDIVIPLIQMAREREITYDLKSGWSTELTPDVDAIISNGNGTEPTSPEA